MVSTRKLPYEEFLEECKFLRSSGECPYYSNIRKININYLMPNIVDGVGNVNEYVSTLCTHNVCPYEVSRMYMDRARVGIMTYYYIFSINKPETMNIDVKNSVLVIDEAHNLPDTISSLNSIDLPLTSVVASINEVRRLVDDEELRNRTIKILRGLQTYMVKLSKVLEEETMVSLELGDVLQFFEDFQAITDAYYEIIKRKRSAGVPIPYTPLSRLLDFHRAILNRVSGFSVFLARDEQGVSLVYKCVDPSVVSGPVINEAGGVVLMSGTLPPRDYVTSMLGISRGIAEYRIGFRDYVRSENYGVLIYDGVTTRYVERDEEEYAKIANILSRVYQVYPLDKAILSIFPSYAVLKSVRKYLSPSVKYIMELGNTSIDDLIRDLRNDRKRLIMAVAGGKLVEGVEYRLGSENLLGLIIIVGVPYPEPNDYLDDVMEILAARLNDRKLAWELTYQWPAIVRIKQAVGRAFRSESDRALVVLMDRRFREARLAKVFEDYFGKYVIVNEDALINEVLNFNVTPH
ncbi:ATP-dependent DNA helicase [Vulcanisaeta sp. JCM 16159]|uniref:ATP-dependent DNA helicase n=1 Tax=Vulcanisaeta sp. JCM 16159 TaxID=1295371 RepID=UPI000A88840E|nr:ATP-dependent DNA helicase [Vulcanisaeta sp. JCM 16159]